MLLDAAEQRRQRRFKADLIEAVASGYGGCRGKKGPRAMQQMLDLLRR